MPFHHIINFSSGFDLPLFHSSMHRCTDMRFRCGKPCYIRQSCLFLHDIQNRLCKKLRIFVSKISIIRYPTNVSLNSLCPSETTRNCWFTEKEKSRNIDFTNYRRYCRRIVCWYSTIPG